MTKDPGSIPGGSTKYQETRWSERPAGFLFEGLALPLALAGLALAAWHSGLYMGLIPQDIAPCTKDGPSCSGPAQIILGLPIPYLSLAAFAAILACLILPKGNRI